MDFLSSTHFYIMDTVRAEYKHCVVIGDMNVDLLKFSVHTKTNDYIDNIFKNGCIPTITKPTRITSTSVTLMTIQYLYQQHNIWKIRHNHYICSRSL